MRLTWVQALSDGDVSPKLSRVFAAKCDANGRIS